MKNILVALNNNNEKSVKTFYSALKVAISLKAKLWIFTCQEGAMIGHPNPYGPETEANSSAAWLFGFVDLAKENKVEFGLMVAQGTVRGALLKAVEDSGAELLVLGRTERTLLANAMVGLSSYVLQEISPNVNILFS